MANIRYGRFFEACGVAPTHVDISWWLRVEQTLIRVGDLRLRERVLEGSRNMQQQGGLKIGPTQPPMRNEQAFDV
jgi:hypothetical protein